MADQERAFAFKKKAGTHLHQKNFNLKHNRLRPFKLSGRVLFLFTVPTYHEFPVFLPADLSGVMAPIMTPANPVNFNASMDAQASAALSGEVTYTVGAISPRYHIMCPVSVGTFH